MSGRAAPERLFDAPELYDDMLQAGLSLSGEDRAYFLRGRMRELRRRLPRNLTWRRILDYGCGTGEGTRALSNAFPGARVVGIDISVEAIEHARRSVSDSSVSFVHLDDFRERRSMDLCYVNGVLHHVPSPGRPPLMAFLRDALRAEGYLAVFENTPWNPGARIVMRRIPFDRDAEMISAPSLERLLGSAGFRVVGRGSLFYFPRWLSALRGLESVLGRLPLGAQYYLLGRLRPGIPHAPGDSGE